MIAIGPKAGAMGESRFCGNPFPGRRGLRALESRQGGTVLHKEGFKSADSAPENNATAPVRLPYFSFNSNHEAVINLDGLRSLESLSDVGWYMMRSAECAGVPYCSPWIFRRSYRLADSFHLNTVTYDH